VPIIDDWLHGAADVTGTDAAFATLLELWKVEPPADGAQPCRYVAGKGLSCEHQLGSWALLRALNEPAILELVDSSGNSHQVVLTALDGAHATLRAGAHSRVVALDDLDCCWFGEFLVIWRPAPGLEQLMLPGMRSEGVRWLRGALVELQGGEDVSSDPARYDQVLVERVRTFQRNQGLKADGKVGVQTLIALSTVLNESGSAVGARRRRNMQRSRASASPIRRSASRISSPTRAAGRLMNPADSSATSRSNSSCSSSPSVHPDVARSRDRASATTATTKLASPTTTVFSLTSTPNSDPSRRRPTR